MAERLYDSIKTVSSGLHCDKADWDASVKMFPLFQQVTDSGYKCSITVENTSAMDVTVIDQRNMAFNLPPVNRFGSNQIRIRIDYTFNYKEKPNWNLIKRMHGPENREIIERAYQQCTMSETHGNHADPKITFYYTVDVSCIHYKHNGIYIQELGLQIVETSRADRVTPYKQLGLNRIREGTMECDQPAVNNTISVSYYVNSRSMERTCVWFEQRGRLQPVRAIYDETVEPGVYVLETDSGSPIGSVGTDGVATDHPRFEHICLTKLEENGFYRSIEDYNRSRLSTGKGKTKADFDNDCERLRKAYDHYHNPRTEEIPEKDWNVWEVGFFGITLKDAFSVLEAFVKFKDMAAKATK